MPRAAGRRDRPPSSRGPGAAPDSGARFTLVPGSLEGKSGESLVNVPAFSDADLEALRDGLLPNSTDAGRSIGRVARSLCGLSVGIALGAGSVRGFAHWGVLRAFDKLGLHADYIAGTSVGGSVAALYAIGRSNEEGIDALVRTGPHLVRYGIPRKGLLSNRSIRRFLHNEVGDIRIEDLQTPLALVAADILTQQEVVFRTGLLWQAVMASLSIPGVYPALWIGEHLVVDGGVLNPVPVSVAAEMGAGVVVAVKLVGEAAPHTEVESVVARGTPPSALSVIMRSIELMQGRIVSGGRDGARRSRSRPGSRDLPSSKLKAFADGGRFVDLGEEAAEQAMPRITAALPWLRAMSITETDTIHWLAASDGEELPYRYFPADPAARRGSLVYLHGIQSHGAWYVDTAAELARRGYSVYLPDRRGSGISKGPRGYFGPYRQLVDDVASFVELAKRDEDGAPAFVVGGCWGARPARRLRARGAGRARGARARLPGAQGPGRPLAEGQAPGRARPRRRRAPQDPGPARRPSCSPAIRSTSSSSATTRSACTR